MIFNCFPSVGKIRLHRSVFWVLWLFMILSTSGWAIAANVSEKKPELILVAPRTSEQAPLKTGSPTRFMVLFTNPWEGAVFPPDTLELTLTREKDNLQMDVIAWLIDPREEIGAKGFLKKTYGFDLPHHMTGLLSISHADAGTNTALFHAAVSKEKFNKAESQAKSPMEEQQNQFQPFFVNFSAYKPVYFLFGVDPGIQKSSFQISFKYKLFNFDRDSFLKSNFSGLEKIHLAYTQQSFWDLKSDSAPFEDSRYMPEIFYYNDNLGLDLPYMIGSGIQAGFQHESNGRDVDSRSTNYGYFQPILAFKFTEKVHLKLAPKAWVYIRNDNETNGDLADYRGYFDIETKIGDPQGLALENHFRHGKEGGTWQFDLSYPLNQIPWLKGFVDVYLHAQYFTGYSDNLIRYNQREDVFRLGFSLVR